jgi:hypothetical protein
MIIRAALATALVLGLLAAPLAAEAQKSDKTARVAVLEVGPTPSPEELAKSVSTNPLWQSIEHGRRAPFRRIT